MVNITDESGVDVFLLSSRRYDKSPEHLIWALRTAGLTSRVETAHGLTLTPLLLEGIKMCTAQSVDAKIALCTRAHIIFANCLWF